MTDDLGLRQVPSNTGTSPDDFAWVLDPPGEGVQEFQFDDDRLRVRVVDGWVHWALMGWTSSEADGADPQYQRIAYGEGTGAPLRECRHTWFGEPGQSGYVFYLDGALLAWAFKELQAFFDMGF